MAANTNLTVKITAVDATSAAIDAVARRLGGLSAPVTKVTKSMARLSDVTGVTKLSKAVLSLGGAAVKTGDQLANSLGGIAPLAAALSVGGLAKMTADWAKATQSLSFDATRIGSGVSQLHALEGSARLSGSSAEAASSGLRTLQDTLTDVVGGRNNEALVYFRQLGIAFDDGAGHALRATSVMPKLADALKKIEDRSLRARVGTQLLGGAYEELAPWIDRGSAGMAEYAELARKYGVNTDESSAKAGVFRKAQTELELAFEGLGNAISENVSPSLAKLMLVAAGWIGTNREMFALNIKGWGDDYARAFGLVGKKIDEVVTGTVGWNKALEYGIPLLASRFVPGVAALENALASLALVKMPLWLLRFLGSGPGLAASIIMDPSSTNAGEENTPGYKDRFGTKDPNHLPASDATVQQAMDFFKSQDGGSWSRNRAAGIVAGLARESNLDPAAVGDGGDAIGIGQWHPDRQADFKAFTGRDIRGSSLEDQLRFVQYELTHKERAAADVLRSAQNPSESAYAFTGYERPKDAPRANDIAGPAAERYAAMDSKHEVTIKVQAPAGTQVATTGSGPATVRVERAMR